MFPLLKIRAIVDYDLVLNISDFSSVYVERVFNLSPELNYPNPVLEKKRAKNYVLIAKNDQWE